MGEEEKGFILCNTCLGKVDYGYKWHARQSMQLNIL
jgi:hypothetical protein